jgi:hypothetical protein
VIAVWAATCDVQKKVEFGRSWDVEQLFHRSDYCEWPS